MVLSFQIEKAGNSTVFVNYICNTAMYVLKPDASAYNLSPLLCGKPPSSWYDLLKNNTYEGYNLEDALDAVHSWVSRLFS